MGLSSLFLTSYLLAVSVAFTIPYEGNDRIVGGKAVNITECPYQVALFMNGKFHCGGSIIGKHLVVTAAHCISPFAQYAIRVGSSSYINGGEVYQIDRNNIIIHEYFDKDLVNYDIALIRVHQSLFPEGTKAKTVKLPTKRPNPGVLAKASGWGSRIQYDKNKFDSDNDYDILQAVQVPIVEHAICQESYTEKFISNKMICAGYMNVSGKSVCHGDSGGPLVVDSVLIGIVSWGYGCAMAHYPGVYTDVFSLLDWIKLNGGYNFTNV